MTELIIESCPELCRIVKNSKRLIDTGLLHHEASVAGNLERYRRGETSHTIHVWWARRPHVAMRSLTYATVCKSLSNSNIEMMSELSLSYSDEDLIAKARKKIIKGYKERSKFLDMFGGGGTIPYEALNLGLDSYSIDSNELSVFIQKANLQYLHDVDIENLGEVLKQSGERVLSELKKETDELFPRRNLKGHGQIINYLWTYAYPCTSCGKEFSLSKRFWLSKKKGKNLYIKVTETASGPLFETRKCENPLEQTNWAKRENKVECPHCNSEIKDISIKKARDILAIEVVKEKTGKSFQVADNPNGPFYKHLNRLEEKYLKELDEELPKSKLPKWSGIVNPALYGIDTHADIFNPRQRVVCLALLKCLKDEYERLIAKQNRPTAKYIISVLSGLVDQLVDWNCRMSMWISQNEQVGRAFCGPGISMYWDYNETDPVAEGPSNLNSKLRRIIEGAKAIKRLPRKGHVEHASAQSLPFKDNTFDAIVTDPPYYDNIFYTILADNFFAWKRLLLKHIEPNLFANESTNFNHELVASSKRSGGGKKAHSDYCENLNKAINEASRVLKDDGVMSFVYSHSSILGWEAIIRSFRYSPMIFTSVQPLSIERKHRPRAMKSDAVNTCMAFIARNSKKEKKSTTLEKVIFAFRKIMKSDFPISLKDAGWCDEDIAIGLMAHGVAIISNVSGIENTEDVVGLIKIENLIREKFPNFKLNKRMSI